MENVTLGSETKCKEKKERFTFHGNIWKDNFYVTSVSEQHNCRLPDSLSPVSQVL